MMRTDGGETAQQGWQEVQYSCGCRGDTCSEVVVKHMRLIVSLSRHTIAVAGILDDFPGRCTAVQEGIPEEEGEQPVPVGFL